MECYYGNFYWNVCLKTKVSLYNHKDILDAAILNYFQHNIKNFNNWFEDRRKEIIRYEEADNHEERTRHFFFK